jgi:hypothetical protein
MRNTLFIVVVVSVWSSGAFADDLIPPPWDRYTPGTGYASWSFSEPPEGEEVWPDPGEYPDYSHMVLLQFGDDWHAEQSGREGVLEAPTPLVLLRNFRLSPVNMYVQVVCLEEYDFEPADVAGVSHLWVPEWCELTDEIALEGGWVYKRFHLRVREHSIQEEDAICFYGSGSTMWIDQIIVDMPEPATLCLLLIGVAMTMKRR